MEFNDRRKKPSSNKEECTNCYKPLNPKKHKIVYINSYHDKSEQNPLCPTCSQGTPYDYITAISTPKKGKVETGIDWNY
jgi:hypothetical protein